jgi:hypothetical protein
MSEYITRTGQVIDCNAANMSEALNQIHDLYSALRHVLYRNHEHTLSCSACEKAEQLATQKLQW